MKWKGNIQIDGHSIQASIRLKMLDQTLLGEWSGTGVLPNNPEALAWLLDNQGKILDTDIGPISISRYYKSSEQLKINFHCAGAPIGKLLDDILLLK